MIDHEEIRNLVKDLFTMTLHGNVPLETTMKIAEAYKDLYNKYELCVGRTSALDREYCRFDRAIVEIMKGNFEDD